MDSDELVIQKKKKKNKEDNDALVSMYWHID